MSSGLFSCDICANFIRSFSETGKVNIRMKCTKEDEDGVKAVNTVTREGECPFASRMYYGDDDDTHPRRLISNTPDQEPYVKNLANPYRNQPRPKKPKRSIDRY